MGRMLGAFDNDNELDRPDLNKCPDCLCFFSGDACPLCGKICPEEMRAGNRKPVKVKKTKRNPNSGRVVFVPWYHSWWFIILMMFVSPIISIILMATSPNKRVIKVTVIILLSLVALSYFVGIGSFLSRFFENPPVDTSLSRNEYITVCQKVDPEDFYRNAADYNDDYVTMTLTVVERFIDSDGYYEGSDYTTYYICMDTNGGQYEIMIRDCIQDKELNFVAGDVITVYGEGAGNIEVYDMQYNIRSAPCIHVAYVSTDN